MSLTFISLIMLPFALKAILDPSGTAKAIKDVSASPALQIMGAGAFFGFSIIILLTNGINFGWKLTSVPSWLALAVAMKGASCLFPQMVKFKAKFATEKAMPAFGFLGLCFLLLLIYVDTLA